MISSKCFALKFGSVKLVVTSSVDKTPDFRAVDNLLQFGVGELLVRETSHRAQSIGDGHSIRNSDQPRDFS